MAKCKKHPEVELQTGQTAKGLPYIFCPECKKAKQQRGGEDNAKKAKTQKAAKAPRTEPVGEPERKPESSTEPESKRGIYDPYDSGGGYF